MMAVDFNWHLINWVQIKTHSNINKCLEASRIYFYLGLFLRRKRPKLHLNKFLGNEQLGIPGIDSGQCAVSCFDNIIIQRLERYKRIRRGIRQLVQWSVRDGGQRGNMGGMELGWRLLQSTRVFLHLIFAKSCPDLYCSGATSQLANSFLSIPGSPASPLQDLLCLHQWWS